MIQSNYKSLEHLLSRIRLVQRPRTKIRLMMSQKAILSSAFLFALALGFVVFVNLFDAFKISASNKKDGAVKIENENAVANTDVNKIITDTSNSKFSDKK